MEFTADSQTLSDLDVFEKFRNHKSVFSLFNHTTTEGGKNQLEYFFNNPLNEIKLLNNRQESIRFFAENNLSPEFTNEKIEFIQYYLKQTRPGYKRSNLSALTSSIRYKIKPDNDSYIMRNGVEYTREFLRYMLAFIRKFTLKSCPQYLKEKAETASLIFNDPQIAQILSMLGNVKMRSTQVESFDFIVRYSKTEEIKTLLHIFYESDAFSAVAKTALKFGFTFPVYSKNNERFVSLQGLFHPFVKDPVSNSIYLGEGKNLCFLTGPNMAGKSTFLKSVGIAVFLAHIGLPVPAQKMELTPFDSLVTGINIPDDIARGSSHFYEEVLRVKKVAEKISEKQSLVVIFDELFRGTNVKDAFDASLAVIKAFAGIKNCLFIISTHIVEIGSELEKSDTIHFRFLGTDSLANIPNYTYRLKEGVSQERLGLKILKDQGIIEILENAAKSG